MKLVTVATHNEGYFDYLKQSCEKFNTDIDVLGYGEKWKGFGWRLNLIIDYLNDIENENEVVCFIDAYDVILLRSLDEMENFFIHFSNTYNINIIIGTDENQNTILKLLGGIIFGNCNGIRINAGTYIGYKKDLLEMLNSITIEKDSDDDQVLITEYFKKNHDKVYIDTTCLFFLTIGRPLFDFDKHKNVSVKDNIITYNGLTPFIAHAPGNTNMNSLIEKLGYNLPKHKKMELNKFHLNTLKKKAFYYCQFFKYIIFVILICLIIYFILKKRKINP